jgi:hypothetical protein
MVGHHRSSLADILVCVEFVRIAGHRSFTIGFYG